MERVSPVLWYPQPHPRATATQESHSVHRNAKRDLQMQALVGIAGLSDSANSGKFADPKDMGRQPSSPEDAATGS
jgi:hypothetical protein